MLLDSLLFYAFAALVLLGAVLTITLRNVVHCAVWLIATLLGVAGLYLVQGAEFLAGVQVIVYIGGIMVLFLFVIMLVPINEELRQRRFAQQKWLAVIAVAVLATQLGTLVTRGVGAFGVNQAGPAPEIGNITKNSEEVGYVLFSEYLLAFELASILLLVAIVGAVVMSKVRTES